MPLDISVSPKNVTATLHYLQRTARRPVRLSFHTSFENPAAPGAPPRESIEVRTLVFY